MADKELEMWIRQYGKDIYSFCVHITHDVQEADELYQDLWLQILKNLYKVKKDGNVKSYCLGIAVRLWKIKSESVPEETELHRKFLWNQRMVRNVLRIPVRHRKRCFWKNR